jgi:hypothetical protein
MMKIRIVEKTCFAISQGMEPYKIYSIEIKRWFPFLNIWKCPFYIKIGDSTIYNCFTSLENAEKVVSHYNKSYKTVIVREYL